MKARFFTVSAVVLSLAAAACGGEDDPVASSTTSAPATTTAAASPTEAATASATPADSATPSETASAPALSGKLTVWLQTDAGGPKWKPIVDKVNKDFIAANPGVEVDVQLQEWGTHLQKLDAAAAADNAPDVVEFGNTETTRYMADGALLELQAAEFEGSDKWLPGLQRSCEFEGKLYCVPYYAGSKAVIYDPAAFEKGGVTAPPKTLDEYLDACDKIVQGNADNKDYSALYVAGKYWYFAFSLVADQMPNAEGVLAKQEGDEWVGTSSTPEAIKGLTNYKALYDRCSKAKASTDEANPWQGTYWGQTGNVASIFGNSWEMGMITAEKKFGSKLEGKLKTFRMPSGNPENAEGMPVFLGGSDLAVMKSSDNADLAKAWIKAYTNAEVMAELNKENGVIPNASGIVDEAALDEVQKPFFEAASKSWFVPTAENWADVEKATVMQNVLADLTGGKITPEEAGKQLDEKIEQILNDE